MFAKLCSSHLWPTFLRVSLLLYTHSLSVITQCITSPQRRMSYRPKIMDLIIYIGARMDYPNTLQYNCLVYYDITGTTWAMIWLWFFYSTKMLFKERPSCYKSLPSIITLAFSPVPQIIHLELSSVSCNHPINASRHCLLVLRRRSHPEPEPENGSGSISSPTKILTVKYYNEHFKFIYNFSMF